MRNKIENNVKINKYSVWVLDEKDKFVYSEGQFYEQYLEKVFLKATDLSSNSYELERYIKDWSSEYHLSRKRSQLLRGFDFNNIKKVLEVGCGCGAITRFLGETFEDVLAIEGSEIRARLARLRTKNMDNVSIICAPFQEIKFKNKFDIIFCIGVFEYSNLYVNAVDPYDFVLEYFHDILTPDGIIVIAIENQFGLKYFSSSSEDHTGIMFDGLEGYPRYSNRERTFGYDELKRKLSKYFKDIKLFFPYPDYKIPSCIFSEKAFDNIKLGEIIGTFQPRDYMGTRKPLFNEKLVLLELDKNNKLTFFANSFLVFAGKHNTMSIKFNYMGLMYSNNRLEKYHTVTQIVEHKERGIRVKKIHKYDQKRSESEKLILNPQEKEWIDQLSLYMQIMKRIKEENITIEELFKPCKIWLQKLESFSSVHLGRFMIDGKHVDSIWGNTFIKNSECYFIDDEFIWHEKIAINVLIIKSVYNLLYDIRNMNDLRFPLNLNSTKKSIRIIAESFGIKLKRKDFKEFCKIESEIAHIVYGANTQRSTFYINLLLFNKTIFIWLEKINKWYKNVFRILHTKMYVILEKIGPRISGE
jgi:SAM-dependent methyltransferase